MATISDGNVVKVFKFRRTGLAALISETADYLIETYGSYAPSWPEVSYEEDEDNFYFVVHDRGF